MRTLPNEEWCWSSIEYQQLSSYPLAHNSREVALLVKQNGHIYIRIHSKCLRYAYEWGRNTREARTVWELECQKSRLINEGFKMNWDNYQLVLNTFNKRFKKYSPYLGK